MDVPSGSEPVNWFTLGQDFPLGKLGERLKPEALGKDRPCRRAGDTSVEAGRGPSQGPALPFEGLPI